MPNFIEFNQPGTTRFLVFRFHGYFDGLLGLDSLTALGAKVDLANKLLITKNSKLPLLLKPNFMSQKYILSANSKTIVNLPVDVEEGDILINTTYIKPHLYIPEGVYKAVKWYSNLIVINTSNSSETLFLEQPLKVSEFNKHNYCGLNNFEINNNAPNTSSINSDDIANLVRTSHLNIEEKKVIHKLCRAYEDIFFKDGQNLTFTNKIKHSIKTTDDIPTFSKSYRYPYIHKQEVKTQIKKMLEQGVIRPSYSPWSSPIWIVPKKKDASGKVKWRLVIDYRKLNEKTVSDKYPLPNITDVLDKLGRSVYFTTLDLASGFHQIEMNPSDIEKTAFTVEGGHYEYVRMPFGLKNAPSTFQRVMDNVLKDLQGKICLVYLDDIIVFSTSLQEHSENLEKVFKKLREANFKIQLDKAEFLHKEVAFLGHLVTSQGVKPNPDKIKAIQDFPIPRTQKEIKSFLGLLGYYRKFIRDFAKLTKPLTECLKKGKTIELNDRYISAFELSKDLLINDPILQYPDFSKPFILTTDASNFALGAILSQGTIGSDKPICYASRTLTDTETNYSTIEKELLAIVWATKYFRPYLFGHKFKIVTDHKPLQWLMSLKDPNSKLVRWRLKLEEFDYEIVYKKGKLNSNADALSRIKTPSSETKVELNANDINAHNPNSNCSTIHSATENLDDHIYISERPLNEFNIQLILKTSERDRPVTLQMLFKNKQRRTVYKQHFSEDSITNIFKQYLPPNKCCGIYTDDETFRIIQSVYSKYFSNSKIFRLIRCTEILSDVTENDAQDQIITDYHNNNNHRGINETLLHLKRQYYFPYMKTKITKIINNCESCQVMKYDRNPPKIKYENTETPVKPLDIIHIDVYSINNRKILTIIDKFSKFAAAYTLSIQNSLNVIKSLKHFMSLHGIPKKLISDQGSEFTALIFKDFCKQYNIDLHITSFQQSSSNSPVERMHSTFTEIYRIIYNKHKERDHDDILNETVITYNNAIHSATKITPYELFYGRTYKFDKEVQYNNEHEYLKKLNEFQEKLYPSIKKQVEKLVSKNINKLNISREDPKECKENSIILRKEFRRNKLTPRFSKHRIKSNRKVTVITSDNRKLHKSKIKRKRKFQITNYNDVDDRTENGNTEP